MTNLEKIGKFYKIPKGTIVFCIALQANITFEKDEIIQITQMVHNRNYGFGCLLHSFDFKKGQVMRKSKNDLSVNIDNLVEVQLPEYVYEFIDYWYTTEKDK